MLGTAFGKLNIAVQTKPFWEQMLLNLTASTLSRYLAAVSGNGVCPPGTGKPPENFRADNSYPSDLCR